MKTKIRKKCGFALVTVLGIIAVMAISFTMLVKMGQQGTYTGQLLRDRTKATAYAEAGIELAYALLREDFDNRDKPGVFRIDTSSTYTSGATESSYGEGTFSISITNMNDQFVVINSIGNCRRASSEVEAVIEDTNWTPASSTPDYGTMDAFTKAIAGGSSGSFKGGGSMEGNPTLVIHLNNDMVIGGSIDVDVSLASHTSIDLKKKNITGDATAPIIAGDDNLTGTPTPTAVPKIYIPPINFTPFYNEAVKNSQYVSGNITLNDFVIPGGVMYVDGLVSIKGNVVGTIIARDGFKITKGGIKVNPDSNLNFGIAAGTSTGNISDLSTGDSKGLFYTAKGRFDQNAAGGNITGQIIAGGVVDKAGSKALIFELFLPNQPGVTTPTTL